MKRPANDGVREQNQELHYALERNLMPAAAVYDQQIEDNVTEPGLGD
jgi:uncharacterized protein YjbK